MRKICPEYCGVACIDGSCPMANIVEYMERDYDVVHNCNECHYYRGCKDCYFYDNLEYPCERKDRTKYSG